MYVYIYYMFPGQLAAPQNTWIMDIFFYFNTIFIYPFDRICCLRFQFLIDSSRKIFTWDFKKQLNFMHNDFPSRVKKYICHWKCWFLISYLLCLLLVGGNLLIQIVVCAVFWVFGIGANPLFLFDEQNNHFGL